jgi:hypothetical protein
MSDFHRVNSSVHTKTFAFPLPKTLARYASICGCISYLDLMTATFIVNGGRSFMERMCTGRIAFVLVLVFGGRNFLF